MGRYYDQTQLFKILLDRYSNFLQMLDKYDGIFRTIELHKLIYFTFHLSKMTIGSDRSNHQLEIPISPKKSPVYSRWILQFFRQLNPNLKVTLDELKAKSIIELRKILKTPLSGQ